MPAVTALLPAENGHAQDDGEVQDTAYAAEGRHLAGQIVQAASAAGTDSEHVVVDMPAANAQHQQTHASGPHNKHQQPERPCHSASMPNRQVTRQQRGRSGPQQHLRHAATMGHQDRHQHSMRQGPRQQHQLAGEGEQANGDAVEEEGTRPHDSAHSQEAAEAADAQARQRSLQRAHGSRFRRYQVTCCLLSWPSLCPCTARETALQRTHTAALHLHTWLLCAALQDSLLGYVAGSLALL